MSIAAVGIYAAVILYVLLTIAYRDYTHVDGESLDYDQISLPSFLRGIGTSIASRSKNGGRRKTRNRSRRSRRQSNDTPSTLS